jgi:outer membrane protein
MLAQGNVALNYTLYDGGARSARIDRAEAQVDAAQSGAVSARRTILAEGVRAYLRVRTTRELQAAQQRRVVALTGERDRARRIFDAGRAPRLLLTRAEAALSAAEADATTSRLDVDLAERDLARLTGLDLERVRGDSLQPLPTAPSVPPSTREALLERAREANPDLLRLRQQVSAAEHGRGEARALWLPRLNVGGRFIQYAARASDPAREWQGGVHVSYPLFTGGARSAAADRASAEVAAARAELAAGELRVSEAIDRALSASEAARAKVAALRAAVEQATEVTRIERLALDAGTGVQSDYILAEAELLRMRAALTEATYTEVLARVELARVTGEISFEWIKQNLEPGS